MKRIYVIAGVTVLTVLLIGILIPNFGHPHPYNETAAVGTLKELFVGAARYQAEFGTFPVGNDPEIINNGKLAMLYHAAPGGNKLEFITIASAMADWRAGDVPGSGTGTVVPDKDAAPVRFELAPRSGYYCALMKFRIINGEKKTFDAELSKHRIGIVMFPAEYKKYTRLTFIVDESGMIYRKDRGETTGYMETWEWEDPASDGWMPLD